MQDKEGYYPNLTVSQLTALEDLKELMRRESFEFLKYAIPENVDLKLLRFLRARQFDIQKTYDMIEAEQSWRNKTDMQLLLTLPVDELSFDLLSDIFNNKVAYA